MQNISSSQTETAGGKITPMMTQFVEIKAANPGSLLFYRMGDFYELFFEDAQIASRALGITLTKRGKHMGEDIPMCGVPYHAADDYLQKLIKLGHRVSVCEQLENPAEAKKRGAKSVVRRGVVRLVTPGTLTEEKLLDPGASNFLCAIAAMRISENQQTLALAWIDISTGSFRTTNTTLSDLSSDLARIAPSELILSQALYDQNDIRQIIAHGKSAITPLPSNLFDSATASRHLCAYFSINSLDGIGTFSKAELTAAAAILAYVEKTQIAEKPALSHPQSESDSQVMLIDAATRLNLELVSTLSGEKQGSLLKSIDRTTTGPGARELARRLTAPLVSREAIAMRHDSVSFFTENITLLDKTREHLKQVPDIARALSRIALNRGGPRDINSILTGLRLANQLAAHITGEPSLPHELKEICQELGNTQKGLIEYLGNTLADELPLLKRDGGFVRAHCHAELDELRELRDHSRTIIAGLQASYAKQTNIKALKIKHNNVLGYFIEISAGNSAVMMSDDMKATYFHRQTLANVMRFTTSELADLETKIANAAGRAMEIELEIFEQMREKLVSAGSMIIAKANAMSALDVACSHACLANQHDYCRPVMSDGIEMEVKNGRHPVIEQVLKGDGLDPFVANDCNIGADENHESGAIWLLTGPNMGGKSTYLRQNALIVLLAQMGSFVPAETAKIGIVDRLFSRVGAADDLARGRSTFMVEMVETAAILNQATQRSFVILDEIGRGTATFDGLSIAWAAIEHLHEVNRCRAIFATHYHELVALSQSLDRLSIVTMKVKEWQGNVVFLHEVTKGAADRSYGIQVAKLAGLPIAVIERAREVLDQLESSEQGKSTALVVDDLPLFNADIKPASGRTDIQTPLIQALQNISPDELSPREALGKLYELRAILADSSVDKM